MKKKKCAFCGEEIVGYGNNPAPFTNKGVVCDDCNIRYVIPARLEHLNARTTKHKAKTEYVIEVRPGEYVKTSKYDTTNIEEAKRFDKESTAKHYIANNLPYGASIKTKESCK